MIGVGGGGGVFFYLGGFRNTCQRWDPGHVGDLIELTEWPQSVGQWVMGFSRLNVGVVILAARLL